MSSAKSSLSPWLDEMEVDNASLAHLQTRIQTFVSRYGDSCRLSLAMAGGGGNFLGLLASTPGASKILLQGSILYDRESYRRFVQQTLDRESFRYASVESSEYAADAALSQSLVLSAAGDAKFGHHPTKNLRHSVGIGSASALSSNDGTNKRSRAFCTVQTSDSFKLTLQARLAKTGDMETDRTRFDEDIFVAHCILTCLEYTLQVRNNLASLSTNGDGSFHIDEKVITKRGDEISVVAAYKNGRHFTTTRSILKKAAELILEGKEDSVLLLAKPADDNGQPDYQILNKTVIPPLSLVFPGSFNPPHVGHVQLVKSAMEASKCDTAWFELSLTNAEKPPIQTDEVVNRLTQFLELREEMPAHWGILLTNAPLFKQKVDLLYPLQVSRTYNEEKTEVLPPLHFVIGTDTLVRILNPKYYDNSRDKMLESLRLMPCRFVVGGRLEQKNVNSSKGPVYMSGEEDVAQLPEDLQSSFTLLDGFRVDISSSEIRRQQSESSEKA
eukprot:CAMPEP_0198148506 /NCGR_PEP_ID=MMETSP1443-20131203/41667_1 /TAXON_ID=186043 /ORGANISM="Entomoneis sp., Strain CCMP2396" /LENGTH=498 /DNA_ID=CAMNT_0043813199 /DNA_START=344 /DNA_END=1840 /DNA_ORIENTATION=-